MSSCSGRRPRAGAINWTTLRDRSASPSRRWPRPSRIVRPSFKTLSLALGSLQLPIPAYQLNFSKHQFGRLFADWLSFTGGSASNGVGGDSMTEFAKSPLAAFWILQEPGAYASTAIVRLETNGANTDNNTEMVLWCIHQKVFEAFWSDGESFPSRVVVDDVLN